MLKRSNIVIDAEWERCLRQHGLDTVEAVYQFKAGEVVAHSGSVEVRRAQLGQGSGARTVFIKKYWVTKPSQLWSGMFRGTFFGRSKVRREHDNLARLRAWQMNAPAPVAYGEERRAGWLVRSFLMSEGIPDPVPLDGFIRDRLPALPAEESRRARRELIEHLAQCTRRLHGHGFVHHDFFWRNILLSGGDLTRFYLIDAHKGRCWRPGHERRSRAMDLAALDAPAPHFLRQTERLRFFLLYTGHQRIEAEDRALLRLALKLAGPMREKQLRRALRRGRPGKCP
jgi:tRNA A-37 threonylcarbamoyl transferase component Bud32